MGRPKLFDIVKMNLLHFDEIFLQGPERRGEIQISGLSLYFENKAQH